MGYNSPTCSRAAHVVNISNAPPPRIRRKMARPHKATLNDTRLEAVELVLIQYFQSPQGRSMGRTFRRIPTPDNPFVVSYVVADDEFAGTIGVLNLAALPDAVQVAGPPYLADETQMNAFMARMATAEGQFYAAPGTRELFGTMLTLPPEYRLAAFAEHIIYDVWRPITQEVVAFLVGAIASATTPDTHSTPLTPLPITDRIDQAILKIIQDADYEIEDGPIAARLAELLPNEKRLPATRESINRRRNKIGDMGHRVR